MAPTERIKGSTRVITISREQKASCSMNAESDQGNSPPLHPYKCRAGVFFPPLRATAILVFVLEGSTVLRSFPRGRFATKSSLLPHVHDPCARLKRFETSPHPHPFPPSRDAWLPRFWGAPFHLERNTTKIHQNEISPPAVLVLAVIQTDTDSRLTITESLKRQIELATHQRDSPLPLASVF